MRSESQVLPLTKIFLLIIWKFHTVHPDHIVSYSSQGHSPAPVGAKNLRPKGNLRRALFLTLSSPISIKEDSVTAARQDLTIEKIVLKSVLDRRESW